jgi:hypothetical protein
VPSPREHHLPKGLLNLTAKITCFYEARSKASNSVATGRVTQGRQVSAEKPDKKVSENKEGSLEVCHLPRQAHSNQSLIYQGGGWV